MEEKKDYTVTQEQLARFAKALGHPARIAIMHFLAKQKTCYFGDIHEELPIAKATVSQHLKELKDAPPHGNPNKVAQTSADNCFLCVVNFVFINFLLVFKDE